MQATGVMTGKFTGAVMISLSYVIWVYLITFSGEIISSFVSKIPVFSALEKSIEADICYVVITTLIAALFSLLTDMFACGLCLFFLKLATGQQPMNGDLFYGFRNDPQKVFTLSFLLYLPVMVFSIPFNIFVELYTHNSDKTYLYLAIASITLAFISAVIMHLNYGLSYYMMLDFPRYSAVKIMGITRKKMHGHKARLLSLEIRFVPLALLGVLSLGIGFLWIYPIVEESRSLFFLNLMNPDHYVKINERV